ncbi:MAG: VWA domain-containing protein [Candidatus Absconditabacteria bacterium]
MLTKTYKIVALIKVVSLIIGTIIIGYELGTSIEKENKVTNSENIVFILDVSNSMNVNDVKGKYSVPVSRLELSKQFINNSIDNSNGIKLGLILFSQNSVFYIPPTFDKNTLKKYVNQITTSTILYGGTNIPDGIEEFANIKNGNYVGVLLSDMGDQEDENGIISELQKIKTHNKIIPVGVGTLGGGLVKYSNGEFVVKDGLKHESTRNDNLGKYIGDKFNSDYYTIENIDEIGNIKPLNTNKLSLEKDTKNNTMMIIGLFMILIGI